VLSKDVSMNRVNYFLYLLPTTFLLSSFSSALVNWFFRDVGNAGWDRRVTPILMMTLVWLLCVTALAYFRLRYVGRSKYWLVFPVITVATSFGFLMFWLIADRVFFGKFFGFFLWMLPLFYSIFLGILPNKNNAQQSSLIYKSAIVLTLIALYLSIGFYLLTSPLRTFGGDTSEPMFGAPTCYNAEYLNIFLFKKINVQQCIGGI